MYLMSVYLVCVHFTGRVPHRRVPHKRVPHKRVPRGRIPHWA
jgi:hypothetical protein